MERVFLKAILLELEVKETINPTVVRLMKEVYGLNLLEKQYPKLLEDLPSVDIVVTMGCNVACPYLPCKEKINWHIEDPTGKDDKFYLKIMDEIKMQVLELKDYLREI